MFAKIAVLFAVAFFLSGNTEAQYLASPYVPAYSAVYSPYVYDGYGYAAAAAYPAYYGWGSNKGAAPTAPNTGKLTNNQ